MMKIRILLLFIICSLPGVSCSKPEDPAARFLNFMDQYLDILEKYSDAPDRAVAALENYNKGKERAINRLVEDLKLLNKKVTADKSGSADISARIKPVTERMLKLLDKNPTLLLNPDIIKVFAPFDLGL